MSKAYNYFICEEYQTQREIKDKTSIDSLGVSMRESATLIGCLNYLNPEETDEINDFFEAAYYYIHL
jgi:hypothetical protein